MTSFRSAWSSLACGYRPGPNGPARMAAEVGAQRSTQRVGADDRPPCHHSGMTNHSGTLADLSQPLALLFDLDGTLVDTVALRVKAWRRAFQKFGLAIDPGILPRYMGSDGRWLAGEVAATVGRDLDWAERDGLDRDSGAIFDELNVSPAPLPGATQLLIMLEASDRLTFAIATASQPGQVAVSVAALRLPAPPPITDGGHVEHAKPAPDLLLVAAAQLGVPPQRCWYVGDSAWDMMACAAARMTGVGVTTGATDAAGLRDAGALAVIDGLPALGDELRARRLI
jgi:beta-phosphoglucomutase-like phosphatase (HAD superfamily)